MNGLGSSNGTEESGSKRLADGTWGLVSTCDSDPVHLAAVQCGPTRFLDVNWRGAQAIPTNQPHWLVNTVGAGDRQLPLLLFGLWWSIGRHGLLHVDVETVFVDRTVAYPCSCLLPDSQ